MKSVVHPVRQELQPTNHSCAQTALSMLLSVYGVSMKPEEIAKECPVVIGEDGTEFGTLTQAVALYSMQLGFTLKLWTSDFRIIDLSWACLPQHELRKRLCAVAQVRDEPPMGGELSRAYVRSYIDLIDAGAEITIVPWLSAEFLRTVLVEGPVHLAVASPTFYEEGRTRNPKLRTSVPDDVKGHLNTHSICVYGYDEEGNFLYLDPWKEAHPAAPPEKLLAAYHASSYLCDPMFFQITPK